MFGRHPQDLVKKRIGDYHVERYIRSGSFGHVYEVMHYLLRTKFALKLMRPELFNDIRLVAEFQQEAETIAKLKHPNILSAIAMDFYNKVPFFVTEFVENGNLRDIHLHGTRVPMDSVVMYVEQIAGALQYAHTNKVVHRDLKPENILFGEYGLLLTDFGIAVTAHSKKSLSIQAAAGTPQYMAPEQFDGLAQTLADQYALAIMIYEWITGQLPFVPQDPQANLYMAYNYMHKMETAPSLSTAGIIVPDVMEQVIAIALSKDPEQRFSSIGAFAIAFADAANPRAVNVQTQIVIQEEDEQLIEPTQKVAALPKAKSDSKGLQLPNLLNKLKRFRKEHETMILKGHTNGITCFSVSPDGTKLASGSYDKTIIIWNLETAEQMSKCEGHINSITCITWYSDSSLIASGSIDNIINIWDTTTGELVQRYNGHTAPLAGIKWSDDGELIASLSDDGHFIIWNIYTEQILKTNKISLHDKYKHQLKLLNGHLLLGHIKCTSSNDFDIVVQKIDIDTKEDTFKHQSQKIENGALTHITCSQDENMLAYSIASSDRYSVYQTWLNVKIKLFTNDKSICSYTHHTSAVRSIDWSFDQQYIASAGEDTTVHIWSVSTGEQKYIYKKHQKGTTHAIWLPDNRIASGDGTGEIHIWHPHLN